MKKYIFFIILIVFLGALPLVVQYGVYIHCTDFSKQQIPFIMETKRMLSSGLPFWSWNTYFGDNFWGSYGFYTLTSPFVWINCFFPYKYMLWGIFFTLILKYICAFLTANFYLRKMYISSAWSIVGGYLYAFSSFAISNTFYYHFLEPLIVFPLLLIAVEKFLNRERYANSLLIAASFLVTFINYYFAIGSLMIAGVYTLCRIFFSDKKIAFKWFALGVLDVAVGCMMASFILIPTALHLAGGPRIGIQSGLDRTAFPFFMERLRVLFMPQIIEQPTSLFKLTGWNSNSVCLPVVGMFFAILYCWKNKNNWLTILIVVSLLIYLSPVNSTFTAFTSPSYTRWAYALCLFLILASVKTLDSMREYRWNSSYSIYVIAVILFYMVDLWLNRHAKALAGENRNMMIWGYAILFVVNMICLFFFITRKSLRILILGISLCVVCQMTLFHLFRSDLYFKVACDRGKQGVIDFYNQNTTLPRLSDDMHYRTEFGARYDNLAMLKNRPSISSSHSIQNNNIRKLICTTDTNNEVARMSFRPNCNWRSFYALMSVKEFIDIEDSLKEDIRSNLSLNEIEKDNDYAIYQNRDYIPMGFTYDTYIDETIIDSINKLNPKPDVPLQLLANLVVKNEDIDLFEKYLKPGSICDEHEMDSIVKSRNMVCCSEFNGTTTGFTSQITMPRDNFVFYSVPADKGFRAYVDHGEKPIYNVNLGLSAVLVPKGTHTVSFQFIPHGLKVGITISVLMLFILTIVFFSEKRRIFL